MSKYHEVWKLEIRPDEDPPNPIADAFYTSKMICWHREYTLGDDHSFADPDDFREKITEENHVICPLFMFDHSGISLSITPFSCPWDSGQVGFVYVSKDAVPGPVIGEAWRARAMRIIREEVEDYSAFVAGEVFGYTLYLGLNSQGEPFMRPVNGPHELHEIEWEFISSCWNIVGHDAAKEYILSDMPDKIRPALEEEPHIDMYGDTVVWVPAENPPIEEKELSTTRLRGGVTLQEKEYE